MVSPNTSPNAYTVDLGYITSNQNRKVRRALLIALTPQPSEDSPYCAICGWADHRVLQITEKSADELDGREPLVRAQFRSSYLFYAHVLKFPGDYRLICANCRYLLSQDLIRTNRFIDRVVREVSGASSSNPVPDGSGRPHPEDSQVIDQPPTAWWVDKTPEEIAALTLTKRLEDLNQWINEAAESPAERRARADIILQRRADLMYEDGLVPAALPDSFPIPEALLTADQQAEYRKWFRKDKREQRKQRLARPEGGRP